MSFGCDDCLNVTVVRGRVLENSFFENEETFIIVAETLIVLYIAFARARNVNFQYLRIKPYFVFLWYLG